MLLNFVTFLTAKFHELSIQKSQLYVRIEASENAGDFGFRKVKNFSATHQQGKPVGSRGIRSSKIQRMPGRRYGLRNITTNMMETSKQKVIIRK